MILLEYGNRILEEAVRARLDSEKADHVDITLADFDGVQFHVSSNQSQKNLITVSISWRCIGELIKHGATEVLQQVYGNMLQETPEPGYDVTLQFDSSNPGADKDKLPAKIGLLKRHILAGPFKKVFEAIDKGTGVASLPKLIQISYRDDEAFFIKPENDRAIIIFSIVFKDEADQVISKVFLQEFADARRTMSNAPAVSFAQKEAPLELRGVPGIGTQENVGYVSFVLFKGHVTDKVREKSIDNIQTFRDYLHYHIKCSKAFLHTRMRNRVSSLLQVLNRAKMEMTQVEKKTSKKTTMSGRTFNR